MQTYSINFRFAGSNETRFRIYTKNHHKCNVTTLARLRVGLLPSKIGRLCPAKSCLFLQKTEKYKDESELAKTQTTVLSTSSSGSAYSLKGHMAFTLNDR